LLLWEWKVKATTIGAGLSYNITNSLLGGIEYSFSKLNADSSKYIDSRFSNINSNDNLIKVGFDYSLFENLFLRAGYNYGKLGNDLIGGGKNVSYNVVTAGAGIKISNITNIDLLIGYSSYKPENLNNNVRNNLSGQVILTLYNF
jgi:opacity protein-like surface antigen